MLQGERRWEEEEYGLSLKVLQHGRNGEKVTNSTSVNNGSLISSGRKDLCQGDGRGELWS